MKRSQLPEINKRRAQYHIAVMGYMGYFEGKQKVRFEEWVGDIIGGHAIFGDMVLGFPDICYDIDTDQPPRQIMQWYYTQIFQPKNKVSYVSYCENIIIRKN